jgi:signal transduction histidine kinase
MTSSVVEFLLVDDEPMNLEALEAILEAPDYRLLRAEDADTALRLLLAHDVAAIILDIKMPGISGVELARLIKGNKRFHETPILFLTAHMIDDDDVVEGYGAGAVDYLTKPVNPVILRHKVAVFANLHRKTRALANVNAELGRLNEKLEERVKERTAELVEADRQKDEFLAVLAHELRNPLAPLRTGLDILLHDRSRTPSPRDARTLGAMDRQLGHLVRLIDDLLDVSRISRGHLELKPERVELGGLVQSTIVAARPWFEKRQQALSIDIEDGIVAEVDPTRFSQILTNLLHNATKFTPNGGSIGVRLHRESDSAVLCVVDSGIGISKASVERAFEMFARISRPGQTKEPGLGVGLALARRLATMHGGSLVLSSEGEGRGTTAELCIPALRPSERAASSDASDVSVGSCETLRIVVVEDNEDVGDLLLEWLEELGHSVILARTGNGGLEAIREHCPDVVLCDLGLPDLDGLEVCRRVRLFRADSQPAMIALTGWGRKEDLRRSREAGFDYHLVKPVSSAALNAALHRVAVSRTAGNDDMVTTGVSSNEQGESKLARDSNLPPSE